MWLDAGYSGEDKGGDWVQKTLGRMVEIVSDRATLLLRKC